MRFGRGGVAKLPPPLPSELRRTNALVAVLLVLTFVVGLTGSGYVLTHTHREVVRLTEAAKAARVAHEAMLDQQTGLRGYVATGNRDLLRPYEKGRAALGAANRALTALGARESELVGLVVEARVAQERWTGFAEAAVAAVTAGPVPDPERVARTFQSGAVLFDGYRAAQVQLSDRLVSARGRGTQ
jgi:CHASE3 domain sensor protein